MNDLNQKEYSEFIKNGLLNQFPQFADFIKFENDIITIEYPSPNGLFEFWITTQDIEVTVGFDDKDGNCSWHTHMSQYGAYEAMDELKASVNLIANIFNEREILVLEDNVVVYLTQNPEDEVKNNKNGKVLGFKKWNEI